MMLDLIKERRLDEAVALCTQILLDNPKNIEARYALGLAQLVSANYPAAMTSFDMVLKARPSDHICAGNLGVACLRSDNHHKAIDYLKLALTIMPDYQDAQHNLGCAYLASKQFDTAIPLLEQLVTQAPNNSDYQCTLADAYRKYGSWHKAVECYQNTLEYDHVHLRSLLNLGAMQLYAGAYDEALKLFQEAVVSHPIEVRAHKLAGDCYVGLELLDEAMDAYANAYELKPGSSNLCVAIGKVWLETGDIVESSSWFDRAVVLDEHNLEPKCCLAKIISDQGAPEIAIELLAPLLESEPDNIELRLTLSDCYWDEGDAETAMSHLNHILLLQPYRLQAIMKSAIILSSSGDTHGALQLYQKILKYNSHFIPALNGVASSQKSGLEDSQVEMMETMLKLNTTMKAGQRAALHNGLAHYYDAMKKTLPAASHIAAANQAQWEYRNKRDWNYTPSTHAPHISKLIKLFSEDYFKHYGSLGCMDITPVFIVAMPRSGTTLTEQILSRHSQVLGVGERPFASQSFHAFSEGAGLGQPDQFLEKLSSKNIQLIAKQYLQKLHHLADKANKQGVRYIVDKMPENYLLLGWVLTLFPKAKIIHTHRNSRDVALSCWITQFDSISWACHESHIVDRIQQYDRIMQHWRSTLGDRIHESGYELLVANQRQQTEALLEFLDLDWEDDCLSFFESDRLVRTASITQVRQPLYNNSVEKWRRYEQYIPELFEGLT